MESASDETFDLLDQPDRPLAPGLYLVGTPIGNLGDITLRAIRVLRTADRIACEDTRQTQKLLNHFGIATPTISCHEHNEAERIPEFVAAMKQGARIAVVSDAGMPGISDPGMHLASAAIEAGIAVYPIPGANAALNALVASGLNTGRFFYAGFLPAKAGARRAELEITVLIETSTLPQEGSSSGSIAERIAALQQSENLDEKDALKRVARERGLSKSEVYRELQRERAKR
jgi:16S rRNA C1402 (ribose-2'-O) methylase RsmI